MEAASELKLLQAMKCDPQAAAIVVDMQPDFYSAGALPVPGGEELIEPLLEILSGFSTLVFTQDSHPQKHVSFASSYVGKKPFETLSLAEARTLGLESYLSKTPGQMQVLWPDHCVRGSSGWELDSRLPLSEAHLILRKGTKPGVDSYSAFFENDGTTTGLAAFLKARGVTKVFICGLAGDYCVLWTAQDAKREGFQVLVSEKWTRFVDFPAGSKAHAISQFNKLNLAN